LYLWGETLAITIMWDQIYYDNSLNEWGISILIIIGAMLVNKLIFILIKPKMKKNATSWDNLFFVALEKPVLLGVMLLAIWIAASRLQLAHDVRDMLKKSYDVLVVLNITWFFARFASALIETPPSNADKKQQTFRFSIDARLYPIFKRTVLIIVWTIGIVTALHNAGIEITALLSTLGIGGIAFALAAQDSIKNIFGGVTIFTDKPFRIGDTVKIDSTEGTVVDIGLRSTRILNYDKRIVTIPNFKVMDSFITNISSEQGRRVVMELGLTYDTTIEKMQEAIQILNDMPNRIPEIKSKDLVVSFTDFEESAMIITFIYFIHKSAGIFPTRSKVNIEILRSFNQAGLSFAFPSRTVYVSK
jgi:MscS family membrane protein